MKANLYCLFIFKRLDSASSVDVRRKVCPYFHNVCPDKTCTNFIAIIVSVLELIIIFVCLVLSTHHSTDSREYTINVLYFYELACY